MTRKDFEIMATFIKWHNANKAEPFTLEQVLTLTGAMKETNKRFDTIAFLKACGMEN